MQLTPEEMKFVERLRKREQQWPRNRWIILTVGIFSIACYSCILIALYQRMDFEHLGSGEVLIFALLWPKCLIMLILGAYFIGLVIRDWRGNMNRRLLLRLLDAQAQIVEI
jgi:hypothetical protein